MSEVSPNTQIAINRANKAEDALEGALKRIDRLNATLRNADALINIARRSLTEMTDIGRFNLISAYIRDNLPPSLDDSDLDF